MGTGLAYGWVRGSGRITPLWGDSPVDESLTCKGWGPAYELLIGGTVARGLVLGGGFVGQDVSDPKFTSKTTGDASADSQIVSGSFGVGAFGPFIDWFPDEEKGLHFGTMFGLALLGLGDSHSGIAGSLWGGYDFWVSSQWSLGTEARVVALRSSHSMPYASGSLQDKAISAELVFTALYH